MHNFKSYLQERKYRDSTIKNHIQNTGYFINWLQENGLYEAENIVHKHLMEYVQYEQQRSIDTATINIRLGSISKYFEYLKAEAAKVPPLEGFREVRNPAKTLRIKGKLKKITEQPLSYEQLEQLYYGYQSLQKEVAKSAAKASGLVHQRNIIITGLLVWQGFHSKEQQP